MRREKSARIDRIKLAVEAARHDMNMSDIAEKAGLSRGLVSNVRRGCSCRQSTAQRIADALGVELETILETK